METKMSDLVKSLYAHADAAKAVIAALKVENADLRETVLWCQRRLPPSLQPYVTRMLAGDYVVPGDTSE
jgi:hypothetical protein